MFDVEKAARAYVGPDTPHVLWEVTVPGSVGPLRLRGPLHSYSVQVGPSHEPNAFRAYTFDELTPRLVLDDYVTMGWFLDLFDAVPATVNRAIAAHGLVHPETVWTVMSELDAVGTPIYDALRWMEQYREIVVQVCDPPSVGRVHVRDQPPRDGWWSLGMGSWEQGDRSRLLWIYGLPYPKTVQRPGAYLGALTGDLADVQRQIRRGLGLHARLSDVSA